MQRFLGLSEEELLENETLWAEERNESDSPAVSGSDMRSVGISPGAIEGDLDTGADLEADMANPRYYRTRSRRCTRCRNAPRNIK